ncbi:hypothetical protein EC957_005388 [Mortierella hygrophila]|uniref:Reverse transcriptase domain-containing protein n=1 Tax=Mortierella hygrophila TaxID=979708 RepID=A0A9P6JZR2_9FUNG|nr:hypothetical protein EC957_005388 [Mortierella hygrophila]
MVRKPSRRQVDHPPRTGAQEFILDTDNTLKGPNLTVLKGTTTVEPIHIANAIMEGAIQHRLELWTLLQNMRRYYDSLNCRQVQLSVRAWPRRSRVPLLCRIAYDALLVATDRQKLRYTITTPPAPGKEPPMVSNAAFVDDTNLFVPSNSNLERITDVSSEFFRIHGIEINGKKTELLVTKPTHNGTITYGESQIKPQDKIKASRILGVLFSADGKAKATTELSRKETSTICNILGRRKVTDKQCIFIINAVLIPRLLYRMSTTIIPWQEVERITAQYRKVVRQKLGLPSSTPNSILRHTRLYWLRDLKDALAE